MYLVYQGVVSLSSPKDGYFYSTYHLFNWSDRAGYYKYDPYK